MTAVIIGSIFVAICLSSMYLFGIMLDMNSAVDRINIFSLNLVSLKNFMQSTLVVTSCMTMSRQRVVYVSLSLIL